MGSFFNLYYILYTFLRIIYETPLARTFISARCHCSQKKLTFFQTTLSNQCNIILHSKCIELCSFTQPNLNHFGILLVLWKDKFKRHFSWSTSNICAQIKGKEMHTKTDLALKNCKKQEKQIRKTRSHHQQLHKKKRR